MTVLIRYSWESLNLPDQAEEENIFLSLQREIVEDARFYQNDYAFIVYIYAVESFMGYFKPVEEGDPESVCCTFVQIYEDDELKCHFTMKRAFKDGGHAKKSEIFAEIEEDGPPVDLAMIRTDYLRKKLSEKLKKASLKELEGLMKALEWIQKE